MNGSEGGSEESRRERGWEEGVGDNRGWEEDDNDREGEDHDDDHDHDHDNFGGKEEEESSTVGTLRQDRGPMLMLW